MIFYQRLSQYRNDLLYWYSGHDLTAFQGLSDLMSQTLFHFGFDFDNRDFHSIEHAAHLKLGFSFAYLA